MDAKLKIKCFCCRVEHSYISETTYLAAIQEAREQITRLREKNKNILECRNPISILNDLEELLSDLINRRVRK